MTLTETAYYTKKLLPFGLIMLLVLFIFYYAIQLLFVLLRPQTSLQSAGETLTYNIAFERISLPAFSEATTAADLVYKLDTFDGTPTAENATAAAEIYFIPRTISSFRFAPQVYLMAKAAGFDTETQKYKMKEGFATFDDGLRTLAIDISNFNFVYQYTLAKNDVILKDAAIPEVTQIESTAQEFLRSMERYPETLAQGKTNIVYLKYDADANTMTIVTDPNDANMVEVDYYQPDVAGFAVAPEKYYNSQHYVVLAFNSTGYKVIRAQVSLNEKSTEKVGFYPLKTSEEAWEELKSGKGYIVSAPPDKNVTVKKIILSYVDTIMYQEYLQPVYVFLGEDSFVGYVPAVTDSNIVK